MHLLFPAAADGTATVTPTVELNTLAMKRGEPAVYKNLENRNPHPVSYHNYDFRGMYNQRYVSLQFMVWPVVCRLLWECSGRVLDWIQRVSGLSLTSVAALCPCARHINPY